MSDKYTQYTLDGGVVPVEEVNPPKQYRNKYEQMLDKYGTTEGETCGYCDQFIIKQWGERTYFKCGQIGDSNGHGTDIIKSGTACGLFKKWEG